MIATVTPGTHNTKAIPRVTVTAEDIAAVGHVNIKHFMSKVDGLQSAFYETLQEPDIEDCTSKVDLLWSLSLSFRSLYPSDHPGQPGKV